jgi:hypothetical protein
MEASVEHVGTKKAYVVPAVAAQGAVVEKTLGLPGGIGEPSAGFIIFAGV